MAEKSGPCPGGCMVGVHKPICWDRQLMAHYQRLLQRHISMFKVLVTACVGEVELCNSCMIVSHKEIGAVRSPVCHGLPT